MFATPLGFCGYIYELPWSSKPDVWGAHLQGAVPLVGLKSFAPQGEALEFEFPPLGSPCRE